MNVIFLSHAEKDLLKLPKFDQIAAAQKIKLFSRQPISHEEKLSGFANAFRVRVGSYRIVHRKSKISIDIVLIAHRKEVYRLLKDVLR